MSEKRFNLTIVFCHLILLIPLLLRLLFLLLHWYTPEQDSFFCPLELFCMAGSAVLILMLPKNSLPFHAIWLPSIISAACHTISAFLLNLLFIHCFLEQFGSTTMKILGEPKPVVIYTPFPQFWYYPFAAGICALLGAVFVILSHYFSKLFKFSRNFFWSAAYFCIFILPTTITFYLVYIEAYFARGPRS